MEHLYEVNGLIFWTEREIRLRNVFAEHFRAEVRNTLVNINSAWSFWQIEAPILTPRHLINVNYTNEDVWVQEGDELVLRPETTPGSYQYAVELLRHGFDMPHYPGTKKWKKPIKPPFVVWQVGKSFRREQDQVTKNMRLKEFYQQEFQCLFTEDTKNDYQAAVLPAVERMIGEMVGLPTRIVVSDRLPSYSLATMDVEVKNDDKWMEVCSVSVRTDFPEKARFQTKKGIVEKGLLVLEIAIGLDRCVYNFLQRK